MVFLVCFAELQRSQNHFSVVFFWGPFAGPSASLVFQDGGQALVARVRLTPDDVTLNVRHEG